MKKLTSFLTKLRKFADRKFFAYTALFFIMLTALYAYTIFAIGTDAPKFTYADF